MTRIPPFEAVAVRCAWQVWLNELARHECTWTSADASLAAFQAGHDMGRGSAVSMTSIAYQFAYRAHGESRDCWCRSGDSYPEGDGNADMP